MLDELGPTFVKFGQLLSTRPDVVPPDIVFELQALQDQVTQFPYEDVERVIREELGLDVEQLFLEFEREPVAAASIGQVHKAVLPNGRRVAVKVQRPDAPGTIEADLELLYQVARLVRERVKALQFIDSVALVDEFARTIRQELDYRMEARHAEQFHRHFAGHPHVRVRGCTGATRGRGYSPSSTSTACIRDLDVTRYTDEERRRLAYLIAEAWMTMIFRHGFFHADPHPSNILVLEASEQIGLVDFGNGREALRRRHVEADRSLHRHRQRAHRRPAAPQRTRSQVPEEQAEFVQELRDVLPLLRREPLGDRPRAGHPRGASLIYRMHLQLPTRFVMLDRAIATLGSVGMELYPDFNVFDVAKPYARELMLERFTPQRIARRARTEVENYARMLHALPYQIYDTLEQTRDGQIEIGFRTRAWKTCRTRWTRS